MNPRFKLLASALLGVPVFFVANASALVVDFTTAEGYANGNLNNQPGTTGTWKTSNNAAFTVNTANGGSVALSTSLNGPLAGYNTPVSFSSGTTLTMSMDFQFTQATSSIASSTNAFGLAYATGASSGATTAAATLGRQVGSDFYRLTAIGGTPFNILGTALGISSGDNLSDVIRLSLSLTYSSGTSTWSGVATLFNVNTNTTVATITRNNFAIASIDPASTYGTIQIGNGMTTSGLADASVLNFTSPTPVPEPGTVVLAGLGATAILFFRRRMTQAK